MALNANLIRRIKEHRQQTNESPAAAGHLFYLGAAVSLDAEGRVVPGALGVLAAGIVVTKKFPEQPRKNHHLDTRDTEDGSWQGDVCIHGVTYDQTGEYYFRNVIGAPVVGGWAYLVDDDTVSADPVAPGIVLGEFTQNKDGGWYVDINKKNRGLPAARDVPFDLVSPVWATLAPDSAPVSRSDVVQISLTNRGDFNVSAGAENATANFFGVAAEDAVPGDVFRVWRGGYYPVRFKDGETLPAFTLLTWENTGARWIQVGDLAAIGRSLQASTGGVGEIVMCEIWWPPVLNLP